MLNEKCLLVSISGKVGNLGVFSNKQEAFIGGAVSVIKFKDTDYLEWVMYYLFSDIGQKKLLKNVKAGSHKNLILDDIRKTIIPIPPKQEQKAIAQALSDIDALITSLKKLIAKKEHIKTATMQQLLTGRKRLDGFGGEWERIELRDAVDFLDHKRKPIKSGDRSSKANIYPYYGASGIIDYVDDFIFNEELILLGEDGENILSRNLPLAFNVSGKIWVNNHAHVLKPKTNFDIIYVTHVLESLDYSLLNSGTAQPKLNKQSCEKIKFLKPSFVEQKAIAQILSDIDKELETLKTKLKKTKNIKIGMMQELLTGKTRLK